MVPFRIVEHLPHDPPPWLVLDVQQRRSPRRRTRAHLVVFGVVAGHGLLPALRVPGGVELGQLLPLPQGSQLNAPEHRVADQDPEGPHVGGHRRRPGVDHPRIELVGGGVHQLFPLVEQAGVHLAHEFPEPLGQIGEFLRAGVLRDCASQRLVRIGQVAQYESLGRRQFVVAHELGEGHGHLVHLTSDGLRLEFVLSDPGMPLGVDVVGTVEQIGQRPRPRDLFDEFDPLLVLDALGLHRGDRLAPRSGLLGVEHLTWVLQRRLEHGQHVHGEGL